MPPTKSIDVVILSWNRPNETIAAIESAQTQVNVRLTVWVIDQGSEESNLSILENAICQYENVKLEKLNKNYGVPGGRNRGIALGKEEIIVCIDNDAIFENERCLSLILEKFLNESRLGVIGFRIENYYTRELDKLSWVYPKRLLLNAHKEFLATRFCGAGHAIRRSAFQKASGYDEDLFFYWEELDLSYKLINLGYQIIYNPNIVILHKISPDYRVHWNQNRYFYLVRNAIYLEWKYFQSVSQLVIKIIGYILKGVFNKLFVHAVKGTIAGLALARKNNKNTIKLSKGAKLYIKNHDDKHRGSFIERVKKDILVKINQS